MSCAESRGNAFDSSKSSTWQALDDYSLGLEANLGYNDSGTYGLETVNLGLNKDVGELKAEHQVVAGISTTDFYTGVFGLGNQGTNFTLYDKPNPTFLQTLKSKGKIPSQSWGYTAGAPYSKYGLPLTHASLAHRTQNQRRLSGVLLWVVTMNHG